MEQSLLGPFSNFDDSLLCHVLYFNYPGLVSTPMKSKLVIKSEHGERLHEGRNSFFDFCDLISARERECVFNFRSNLASKLQPGSFSQLRTHSLKSFQ